MSTKRPFGGTETRGGKQTKGEEPDSTTAMDIDGTAGGSGGGTGNSLGLGKPSPFTDLPLNQASSTKITLCFRTNEVISNNISFFPMQHSLNSLMSAKLLNAIKTYAPLKSPIFKHFTVHVESLRIFNPVVQGKVPDTSTGFVKTVNIQNAQVIMGKIPSMNGPGFCIFTDYPEATTGENPVTINDDAIIKSLGLPRDSLLAGRNHKTFKQIVELEANPANGNTTHIDQLLVVPIKSRTQNITNPVGFSTATISATNNERTGNIFAPSSVTATTPQQPQVSGTIAGGNAWIAGRGDIYDIYLKDFPRQYLNFGESAMIPAPSYISSEGIKLEPDRNIHTILTSDASGVPGNYFNCPRTRFVEPFKLSDNGDTVWLRRRAARPQKSPPVNWITINPMYDDTGALIPMVANLSTEQVVTIEFFQDFSELVEPTDIEATLKAKDYDLGIATRIIDGPSKQMKIFLS